MLVPHAPHRQLEGVRGAVVAKGAREDKTYEEINLYYFVGSRSRNAYLREGCQDHQGRAMREPMSIKSFAQNRMKRNEQGPTLHQHLHSGCSPEQSCLQSSASDINLGLITPNTGVSHRYSGEYTPLPVMCT